MSVDIEAFGFIPVNPDDTFQFQCTRCGDCCHNIKDAVMLESLDFFRLVQFLQMDFQKAVLQYMNMAFLSWGYPVLMLRTRAPKDTCIFLKGSKCSIQSAKPRTCRTYPLGTGPDDVKAGAFENFIVSKKQHHFTGPSVRVKDWMDANLTEADRAYVIADYKMTGELAKILRAIDKRHERLVLSHMLFYRYLDYDVTKDFYEQYIKNMACLKNVLTRLITLK